MARINVSQRNIDNAIRGNARFCFAALSLIEHGFPVQDVTASRIRLNNGVEIGTPENLRQAIRYWDGTFPESEQAGVIAPFSFDI